MKSVVVAVVTWIGLVWIGGCHNLLALGFSCGVWVFCESLGSSQPRDPWIVRILIWWSVPAAIVMTYMATSTNEAAPLLSLAAGVAVGFAIACRLHQVNSRGRSPGLAASVEKERGGILKRWNLRVLWRSLFSKLSLEPGKSLNWGGCRLPLSQKQFHFVTFGVTRSGKTVTMKLLMQSVLPYFSGKDRRAVVYDGSRDFVPVVAAMVADPRRMVKILHPGDRRSVSWDISKDIGSPEDCEVVGKALCPKSAANEKDHAFFSEAAPAIVCGVLESLHLQEKKDGNRWYFSDLIQALVTEERVAAVLKKFPGPYLTYANYVEHGNEKTYADIRATMWNKLRRYMNTAAQWQRVSESVSLGEFLLSDWVMVLGTGDKDHPVHAINRAMFSRLCGLIGEQRTCRKRQTWIFFDELENAEVFPTLSDCVKEHAKRGVATCIGFQDIAGMRELYGKEGADSMVTQAGSYAIMNTRNPESAEWASKLLGKVYKSEDYTLNPDGEMSRRYQRSARVDPTELSELKVSDDLRREGAEGYIIVPNERPHKIEYRIRNNERERGRDNTVFVELDELRSDLVEEFGEEFSSRSAEEQEMIWWTAKDCKRLGLPESLAGRPRPPDEEATGGPAPNVLSRIRREDLED